MSLTNKQFYQQYTNSRRVLFSFHRKYTYNVNYYSTCLCIYSLCQLLLYSRMFSVLFFNFPHHLGTVIISHYHNYHHHYHHQ
uniref:Uncharacterized protein n=1 Tax=Octopus bimaculoides TaxID=37653 RepID=A0A0L8H4L8_OCTBM